MMKEKMAIRFAILCLLLGTTIASHKQSQSEDSRGAHSESQMKPRYSGIHKSPHTYILEEDDHYPSAHGHQHGGGQAEEYVDNEENAAHREQDEAQGNENSDKNVKDEEYNDHAEKGGHQGFEAGGVSFDKHLKDHKADNKEIENVKQHDAAEKFGGEATKEHKLGKKKDKSKGHKLHGFKNVYHKEEYGDHKTFHDEFLDSDHQHNYDDQHEHKEMQGGKFSKGYKHEGKNKKYDKGDEKREWGKEEFDGHKAGHHEKGGQHSRHRHGSKKHQGHYEANSQRNKNAVHKVKKGTPPPYVHHAGHHGPHQAQIQPYVSHYNPHHQQVHASSHHHKPQVHQQSHEVHYDDGHQDNYKNHANHHHDHNDHNQHSTHGDHSHSGHNEDDDGHHNEYSHDDDDHDSDHQERVAKIHHHGHPVNERLTDKNEDKIIQKHEPVAHKQHISPHHKIQQYRQPVYQEHPLYKQPEYIRQEKFSQPFQDKFQNHKVRYGFQSPRNHHYSQPNHHFSQPNHHFSQPNRQLQPFPRFPGFTHHHNHHGHHHHHDHNKHFSHIPTYAEQVKPDIAPRKVEYITDPKQSDSRHDRVFQKQYK